VPASVAARLAGVRADSSFFITSMDRTNLTKVCNSMTMTTKEKRLGDTHNEISQHALVTLKFLTEFVAFYL